MSGGWDEALDAMTGLAHAFKTNEYRDYLARFAESLATSGQMYDVVTGEIVTSSSDTADRNRINSLIESALRNIDLAEPTWVSADVARLIEHAAEAPTFAPQAIWIEELFTPHAFVVFERPLKTIDIRGLEFWYRAISWSIIPAGPNNPAEAGVLVCKWQHRADPDGYGTSEQRGLLGGSPFRLAHVDQIPFGEDRFLVEPLISRSIAQYESLWRLATQKVILRAPERASRATWKRASNWRQIKEVSVLRLRRAEYRTRYEGEVEEGRKMTIRTNTRGHWRPQYYPSLGPVGEPQSYRQIWIDEYIRGPADAPLVLKKHATEFNR